MKKLLLLTIILPLLLVGCAERQARLEVGGAYAQEGMIADLSFYQLDSAFRFSDGAIDAAFKIEEDNRDFLWGVDPNIKLTLDSIRDPAWAAKEKYLAARKVYKAMPVPANLSPLQISLRKLQQLEATATVVTTNVIP